MKIVIMGYSGSGKSTLAKALAQHYQLPKLHLDTLQFLPNWQERPKEELIADLGNFMAAHSSWVIEGNYSFAHYERRMAEADHIILLLFPRWLSLWRVIKRYWHYKGKVREDMAPDCPEKLDLDFILWVLHRGRSQKAKIRYQSVQQQYPDKVIILKDQAAITDFLSQLSKINT
ncbi:DNA topology modulation protein [Streptococcus ovuberis]|uniref:DNA topology modulation protein n=1 Tax=Streptococcus ovuberis TaxID=1936207 RepID=A0A7X6S2E8_9STRE|nr:DNA topology modulation protein [Streptococcus ovuberis]NKZ21166.1 DNA topology modulation protein [Streptococcus ovuberis]